LIGWVEAIVLASRERKGVRPALSKTYMLGAKTSGKLVCELNIPSAIYARIAGIMQVGDRSKSSRRPYGLNTNMHWYVNTISNSSRHCAQ
jgi:hypothetical protein